MGTATVDQQSVDTRNTAAEQQEIDWLKTGPAKVFLYVNHGTLGQHMTGDFRRIITTDKPTAITTWLGTVVSAGPVKLGAPIRYSMPRSWDRSTKRAVSARIFGTLYHGWYYESSGNYCRLKKAKRQ